MEIVPTEILGVIVVLFCESMRSLGTYSIVVLTYPHRREHKSKSWGLSCKTIGNEHSRECDIPLVGFFISSQSVTRPSVCAYMRSGQTSAVFFVLVAFTNFNRFWTISAFISYLYRISIPEYSYDKSDTSKLVIYRYLYKVRSTVHVYSTVPRTGPSSKFRFTIQ